MYILGISCYYHDSSATLLKDGEIVFAAQEERFSRKKHDNSFPASAIREALQHEGIGLEEIDTVAFYEDPVLKFKRILKTYRSFFPKSIPFIMKSLPVWICKKLYWKRNIVEEFSSHFGFKMDKNKIKNIDHHRSHAASAFYPSPFVEAAVLVLDGVGEFATTSIWKGDGSSLEKIEQIDFPDSLGLLYSAFTYFLGFKVNSGEYKVMGLAPYGRPVFAEMMKKNLIFIDDNGFFRLNMDYFTFHIKDYMTDEKLEKLFGVERRKPETELKQIHMDIAASLQAVTEEVMLKLAEYAKKVSSCKNLCLAGGVALNCVGNGKISESGMFDNIWIQPASGDAGGSLGAALDLFYKSASRRIDRNDSMKGSYLGPSFTESETKEILDRFDAKYTHMENGDDLVRLVAEELAAGKVIGLHQGRMEFGPRALGHRSIIGDPRSADMQSRMNLKIKFRESFRPFAPSVLEEHADKYFKLREKSPYMLLVSEIEDDIKIDMTEEEKKLFGIEKLNVKRSSIPAVTHVDYSARVQTVSKDRNGRYYEIIEAFYKKTGCPVVINTSFNVRGEPIVCTPEDSYTCFMRTEMDVLVIDNCILYKEEQKDFSDKIDWKKEFVLD